MQEGRSDFDQKRAHRSSGCALPTPCLHSAPEHAGLACVLPRLSHKTSRVQAGKRLDRTEDADADAAAAAELRAADPMAAYFAAKAPDTLAAADAARLDTVYGDDVLGGESGFAVPQTVPPHSWLRRGVQPLPNRCAHTSNACDQTWRMSETVEHHGVQPIPILCARLRIAGSVRSQGMTSLARSVRLAMS